MHSGENVSESQRRVTLREGEVLSWVAAGKSDWAIARILKISDKTVNFHVENAKRKFRRNTRRPNSPSVSRPGNLLRHGALVI